MTKIPNITSFRASHSNVRATFADQLLGDEAFSDSFEEFRSILEEIGKKVSSDANSKRAVKYKPTLHNDEVFEGGDLAVHKIEKPPLPPQASDVAREARAKSPSDSQKRSKSETLETRSDSEAPEVEETETSETSSTMPANEESSESDQESDSSGAASIPEGIESSTQPEITAVAASSTIELEGEIQANDVVVDGNIPMEALPSEVAKQDQQPVEEDSIPLEADSSELLPAHISEVQEPAASAASSEPVPTSDLPRTVEIPVIANGEIAAGERPEVDLSATKVVPAVENASSKEPKVMEFVPSEPMPKETFELIEHALKAIFEEKSKASEAVKAFQPGLSEGFVPQQFLGLSAVGNGAVLKSLFTGVNDLGLANPLASGKAALGGEAMRAEAASSSSSQPLSAASEASRASQRGAENSQARASKALPRAYESRTLEKVENALKEVVKSRDGKTISFRLDPPSLGTVKIDVSYRDGSLHAKIQPEASQVGNFLRERAYELVGVLRKLGLNVEKITVSVLNFEMTSQDSEAGFRSNSNANEGRSSEERSRSMAEDIAPEVDENDALQAGSSAEQQPLDHWVA